MKPSMLAGAVLALVLSAGAAHADARSELIDRYVGWRGGAAFAAATGLHEAGQAVDGDYKGTLERWQAQGRWREQLAVGAQRANDAFTPDGGWSVTLSGQVETVSPPELAQLRHRALMSFDDALRGAEGALVSLQPDETFDGAKVSVLRVSFGGTDHYDLLLDGGTGALVASRFTEDKELTTTRYADWRMVGGVRMAFQEWRQTADDPRQLHITFDRVEIGVPIIEQVWAAPEAERKFAFLNGGSATTPMPFDFYLGTRISLTGSVNGVAVPILLDSGSEATALDKTWAEQHGIKPTGSASAVGTGGREEVSLATGVTIRIGDVELRNLTVALIDFSGVEKMLGRPLPIVMGKEVFNELAVSLDFQAKTIAFTDPAAFTPPPGAVAVPIMSVNGIKAVPVSIEGRPAVPMDFDLGNGSPLLVNSGFWKPAGLLTDGRPSSKELAGAIGGLKVRDVITVHSLTIGGVTFTGIPATLFGDESKVSDGTVSLGNVGMPILSRFRMTTDFAHDRLWLTPVAGLIDNPFDKDRTGLRLQPPSGQVLLVSPGSPAEAAGLKAGDVVVAINGKPLKDVSTGDFGSLSVQPAGSTLAVTLEGGAVKILTLADYY